MPEAWTLSDFKATSRIGNKFICSHDGKFCMCQPEGCEECAKTKEELK